ncbi:MAG: LysM peptidoglycan-binding domain-containing protein [Luteolibacter sp.]
MSFWTLLKILAALCVFAVMAFTGLLAYHVAVKPLGGIFAKIIPNPSEVVGKKNDSDFAKMLDSADLPDIDPGEKAFQKAHELLALGKLDEAREKLVSIVTVYPTSPSAPVARRIVGEMNLDEILSTSHMDGKQTHIVKKGNSFFSIAAEHKTTIDCIMHLNGMLELKGIQPGEELIVMPLDFKILIEPHRKVLSLWEGTRFIREYDIVHIGLPGAVAAQHTTINSKAAEAGGKRVQLPSKDYRAAGKIIQFGKPPVVIRGYSGPAEEAPSGIVLKAEDMEELNLLTRIGNEVEIRNQPK